MRASATSSARRPRNNSAAKVSDRAVSVFGDLGPRGLESPPDGSDDESAMGAPTTMMAAASATDGKSPLTDRLAVLPTLGLGDLRLEWRRLFRAEPPRLSRDIMMRAIAYRLQEIAHAGLSKVTQRRLMTLANQLETEGRIAPLPGPRIKPGCRLIREWHGRTHTICVTDDGFEFQDKTYRSLTKIAFDITGAHWSGPRFFGLTKAPETQTSKSAANGVAGDGSKTDSDGAEIDADRLETNSESSNG
jgi:hypothetical protein